MRKFAVAVLVTIALIAIVAFVFNVYGNFVLDHSLESLKEALEVSPSQVSAQLAGGVIRPDLESLAFEEATSKDVDFETLTLLEHAARSIRDAVEQSGYARAGLYLSEVLKEKSEKRNLFLRTSDSFYYALKTFVRAIQDFFEYVFRRFRPAAEKPTLEGAGVLILSEAGRMERNWKLEEAQRYYREFLERYPGRPERGFVRISLAHVFIKMGRLGEAKQLLETVQKEFPRSAEDTSATRFLNRIEAIQKQEARIPELEDQIKAHPDLFFKAEGGLELALIHLATYHVDKAVIVLERLRAAPDPRVRAKALFYLGWIHKWHGDFERGKEILELLGRQTGLEKELQAAAQAQLADIYYEEKDYEKAITTYQQVSGRGETGAWKALSELEQNNIYIFGLNRIEEVRDRLRRLELTIPPTNPLFEIVKKRLEEALNRNVRDQAFIALAEGRVEAAKEIFENYLKQFSGDGLALSGLASIQVLKGDLIQALDLAEKGYALLRDEYTTTVLAYIFEKLGRLDEAGRYYAAAVDINPSYLTARFNLAQVYVMTGHYSEGDRLLSQLENQAGKFSPRTQAKILNNRGVALWNMGKAKEATALFQQALEVMPSLAEAGDNLKLAGGREPALARSSE